MAAMARLLGLLAVFALLPAARAAIDGCECDPAEPSTMAARQCSLSREALKQPAAPPFFFLKDANPSKPNRTLALPVAVRKGVHSLADMTPEERAQFWAAAIQKAKELWGDDWGLAVNGEERRTQCQPHIHIGKFLPAAKTPNFIVVDSPDRIPVPKDGSGLWIYPEGGKLHVHVGEHLTETVLLR
jgi:diadenosine tetraphosphate (Ap4A) HIT family hydrolase